MNKNLWGWDSGTQVTLVFRWIENYYSKSQFAKWVFPYSAVWHKKNKSFVSSSFFSAYRSSLVGKFQKRHLNVKNKISFLTLYNKVLKTNQKQEGWRVRHYFFGPSERVLSVYSCQRQYPATWVKQIMCLRWMQVGLRKAFLHSLWRTMKPKNRKEEMSQKENREFWFWRVRGKFNLFPNNTGQIKMALR